MFGIAAESRGYIPNNELNLMDQPGHVSASSSPRLGSVPVSARLPAMEPLGPVSGSSTPRLSGLSTPRLSGTCTPRIRPRTGSEGHNVELEVAIDMAGLAVCRELCAIQAEARNWQLRCYQSEAELRLLKQRRRGEAHPRWPSDAKATESLHANVANLEEEAQRMEEAVLRPVREQASAKMARARLKDQLDRLANEIRHSESMQADAEMTVKKSETAWAQESENLNAREAVLTDECNTAHESLEALELSRQELSKTHDTILTLGSRKEELDKKKVLVNSQIERLAMEIEDDIPRLLKLADSCRVASSDFSRSSETSRRKSEAYDQAEREAQELADLAEECQLTEQKQLQECRTEFQEAGESSVDIEEQLRRARFSHGSQLKAVRQGGAALRAALLDAEAEHSGRAEELSELRAALSGISATHEARLSRERRASDLCTMLDEEVQAAASQLYSLSEMAAQTSKRREVVSTSCGSAAKAQAASREAFSEAKGVWNSREKETSEIREELQQMRSAFGTAAVDRRKLSAERCEEVISELEEEGTRLSERCEAMRSRQGIQQKVQDRQLVARRAASDAAARLRASYADFTKQLREGRTRSASDAAASGKALRRIGRNIDDMLRFLEASEQVEASSNLLAEEEPGMPEEPRLPQSVIDAFAATQEKTQSGSLRSKLLATEQKKVAALRKTLQEANAKHDTEMDRLKEEHKECAEQFNRCELELEEANKSSSDRRAAFETKLREAGIRQTEVQIRGVTDIQRQLQAHSQELGRLGRERAELHKKRCSLICRGVSRANSRSPSSSSRDINVPAGTSPNLRLRMKETEVSELQNRVSAARTRYAELSKEAGGQQAVQEAGLTLPGSPSNLKLSSSLHGPSSPAMSRSSPNSSLLARDGLAQGKVAISSDSSSPLETHRASSLPSSTVITAGSANNAVGSVKGLPTSTTSTPTSKARRSTAGPRLQRSRSPNGNAGLVESGSGALASKVSAIGGAAAGDSEIARLVACFPTQSSVGGSNKGVSDGYLEGDAHTSDDLNAATLDTTRRHADTVSDSNRRMFPDMAINTVGADGSASGNLQFGPQGALALECDIDVSSSAASYHLAESTPSPAARSPSELQIPGSAVLVSSHQPRRSETQRATALEFDDANTVLNGPARARVPRRSDPAVANGLGGFANNNSMMSNPREEGESGLDRPVTLSPGSQPTAPPSTRDVHSPQKRFLENTDDVEFNTRDTGIAEFVDFAALGALLPEQVDLSENSLVNGISLAALGSAPLSSINPPGVGSIGNQALQTQPASATLMALSRHPDGAPPPSASSKGFPASVLLANASASSLHSASSHTLSAQIHAPIRPASSLGAPSSPVMSSSGQTPQLSPRPSPALSHRTPRTSPKRVPHEGRMVWSTVGHVASPGNSRSPSPVGRPGPPRRAPTMHSGPVASWSAIAGEALSPLRGSGSPVDRSPIRGATVDRSPLRGSTILVDRPQIRGTSVSLERSPRSVGAPSDRSTMRGSGVPTDKQASFTLEKAKLEYLPHGHASRKASRSTSPRQAHYTPPGSAEIKPASPTPVLLGKLNGSPMLPQTLSLPPPMVGSVIAASSVGAGLNPAASPPPKVRRGSAGIVFNFPTVPINSP